MNWKESFNLILLLQVKLFLGILAICMAICLIAIFYLSKNNESYRTKYKKYLIPFGITLTICIILLILFSVY